MKTAGGTKHQPDLIRRRALCSSRECDAPSWTVYEDDGYPHRTIQLEVVASAVGAVEIGGKTLTESAQQHRCSRRSVHRYIDWIAGLAAPEHLAQACARLDPDGIASSLPTSTRASPAGHILQLFDRLADLFVVRGLGLRGSGSGLARLLSDQLRRFGDVVCLTRSSPPLRVDLAGLGV